MVYSDNSDSDLDLFEDEHGDISTSESTSAPLTVDDQPRIGVGKNAVPDRDSPVTKDHSHDVDGNIRESCVHVTHDNLSAVDWVHEYSKERTRVRQLAVNSTGLRASFKQSLDSSQSWIVLVFSGLLVGIIAAGVSIASDWLGDVKTGYCKDNGTGAQFYLSKQFCCWGHDDMSKCQDWTSWRKALHIGNLGGAYMVEYIFYVIYATLFAGAAALLVQSYSRHARQSGIPEIKTMLGGVIMEDILDTWTLVTKSLGICLSVASGLWLGKEGPLVHLACCCANLAMKPFDDLRYNEARKREIVSAAAASGISVAFGAPVGGVLFSLEQLSYYFPDRIMWQSFVCAMIAAVTLQALNPFHTGKIVLYQVEYTTSWHGFELFPFILLGLFGGIFGGIFIKLNSVITTVRKSAQYPFRNRPILEVCTMAFVAGLINFPNIFMRAQLSELVYFLFAECDTIGDNDIFGLCKVTTAGTISMVFLLVAAAILGTILTAFTFGLPIPAGIMLPSLAIGGLYGRATGMVVEIIHRQFSSSPIFSACAPDVPCITPGTYAIVGAAAALAGTTRMTVSIVVIMFELTGALTYVLPIMISVLLAKWIGDSFSSESIYETWIMLNHYPHVSSQEDVNVPRVSVAKLMTRLDELTTIDAARHYSVADLRKLLSRCTYQGFPIVYTSRNTSGRSLGSVDSVVRTLLVGFISRSELTHALEHTLVRMAQKSSDRNTTFCYFMDQPELRNASSLDLRPWMNQTPITLRATANLHQAVSMFQKLGLRYLLIVDKGDLRGLLTKKDVWQILHARSGATDVGEADIHMNPSPHNQEDDTETDGLLDQHG